VALLEQHLDFVINGMFRQTLFVHTERRPQIRRRVNRSRFRRLHFPSWTPPLAGETPLDTSEQPYGHSGMSFISADPAVKAALDALNARWPWTISRGQLLATVRARLTAAGIDGQGDFEGQIESLLEILIVQGHARIPLDPVAPAAAGIPIWLTPAVRRMAAMMRDDNDAFVFNPWHEMVPLSPVDRYLIPLLDGRHDRQALLSEILDMLGQSAIRIEQDGVQVVDERAAREILAEEVDTLPQRLADLKLLDLDDCQSSTQVLRLGPKAS
jgi:methyltransferase-like protein